MTDLIQPGQHPDADQLSAFAEHALPPHEQQQTLAHLTHCTECRGIVYLAQQAGEQPEPAAKPTAARKPWFYSWAIAWPVSAALACLLLVAIYIRFNPLHPSENPSNTVATNAPAPPPIPVPTPTTKQLTTRAPRPNSSQSTSTAAPAKAPADEPAQPAFAGLISSKSLMQLPVNGRNIAAAPPTQPAPAAMPSDNAALDSPRAVSANQLALRAPTGHATGLGTVKTAPVASAADPVASTASMQAESHPIEREAPTAQPLGAAPPVQSQLSEPQPNLPSRLRAVSTVSNARLILAIDSAGTLFLSKDSGKRWQAVTPRWTGRAVRVNSSFAVPRTEPAAPLIHSAPIAKAPAATAAGAVFTSEPAESGSLSGTVTDPTGAVIPNARVTVTNTVTSQTLSTVTDSTGLYVFMGLIPGVYRLEAQARGFQTFVRHGITVAASEKALASFSLTIGAETQTVSVQADSLAIETESSVVSGSISSEKPADAHPPAFELTTDTGQVWISSDGRHWKRK